MFRDDADQRYTDSDPLLAHYIPGHTGAELMALARVGANTDPQARQTRRSIKELSDSRKWKRVERVREYYAMKLVWYLGTPS